MTTGRYLCFHKHRCRNLNAYLNIYSRESIFLLKGTQESSSMIEIMIQRKFKGFRKNGGFAITSHVKVFLGNKHNVYIRSARNAKITSTRNVYEKTVMKRKKKSFQRRIWNSPVHLR